MYDGYGMYEANFDLSQFAACVAVALGTFLIYWSVSTLWRVLGDPRQRAAHHRLVRWRQTVERLRHTNSTLTAPTWTRDDEIAAARFCRAAGRVQSKQFSRIGVDLVPAIHEALDMLNQSVPAMGVLVAAAEVLEAAIAKPAQAAGGDQPRSNEPTLVVPATSAGTDVGVASAAMDALRAAGRDDAAEFAAAVGREMARRGSGSNPLGAEEFRQALQVIADVHAATTAVITRTTGLTGSADQAIELALLRISEIADELDQSAHDEVDALRKYAQRWAPNPLDGSRSPLAP